MFVSRSASRILCLACSRLILSCVERWRSWRQSLCCSCGCWAHSSGGGGGGDDGGGEKGGSGGSGDADGGGLGGRPGGRGGSGSGGNFAGGAEGGGRGAAGSGGWAGTTSSGSSGGHGDGPAASDRLRGASSSVVERLRGASAASASSTGWRSCWRCRRTKRRLPRREEPGASDDVEAKIAQAPSILRWVRYRRERGERSAVWRSFV